MNELTEFRNSHLEVFCKKGVLENFAKFAGKNLCHSLFFNEVAGPWWSVNFNKVTGWACNFIKFNLIFSLGSGLGWEMLKLVSTIVYQIFSLSNDSPSKTMKNAFYLI